MPKIILTFETSNKLNFPAQNKIETEKTNIYNTEKYYLIDNFVTKKWSISDYNTASIEKKIAKYFKDKNIEPVIKLKQTLLEYKLIIKSNEKD